jgi:hypothetical protein
MTKIGRRRNRTEMEASKYDRQWSQANSQNACKTQIKDSKFNEWSQASRHACQKEEEQWKLKYQQANIKELEIEANEGVILPPKAKRVKFPNRNQRVKKHGKGKLHIPSCLVEGPVSVSDEEEGINQPGMLVDAVELFPNGKSGFSPCNNAIPVVISSLATNADKTENELRAAARAIREQKAVKADDAEAPLHLWEEKLFAVNPSWRLQPERFETACKVLRRGMLGYWKTLVRKSLTNWIDTRHPTLKGVEPPSKTLVRIMPPQGQGRVRWRQYTWNDDGTHQRNPKFTGEVTSRFMWKNNGLQLYKDWWQARMRIASWDLVPGIDAVARAANASWFEWDDGSRPFHWRWPEFYQQVIRDGLKVHFRSKKPTFKRPQAGTKCEEMRTKMRKQLDKVRKRRYIAPGFVSSLTSFFAVPKGSDDIRMVYDASVSGLNDSI